MTSAAKMSRSFLSFKVFLILERGSFSFSSFTPKVKKETAALARQCVI
jgi:hypothetical protein